MPGAIGIVEEMSAPVSRTFPALPSALYEVRKFVREEAERAGLGPAVTNDVILAVSEAGANAVLHSASSKLEVTFGKTDECVEISVRDEGTFVRRVPLRAFERTSGHGIPLMMALMDEVSVKEGSDRNPGTTVTLRKCRGW
jgi:anti-sigma regulatory factor (Ser/Thr protein kinase)